MKQEFALENESNDLIAIGCSPLIEEAVLEEDCDWFFLFRKIKSSTCCCGDCDEWQDIGSGNKEHIISLLERFDN